MRYRVTVCAVTSAGAAGVCSLRAAVAEANAWSGADSIAIKPGVNVNLTRATAAGNPDFGDLDVTDDLTISGGGTVINAVGINPSGVFNAVFDVTGADLTTRAPLSPEVRAVRCATTRQITSSGSPR